MDISFANNALRKQLNEEKAMIKVHGPLRTKKLKIALTASCCIKFGNIRATDESAASLPRADG
jgi:hypothetical protein